MTRMPESTGPHFILRCRKFGHAAAVADADVHLAVAAPHRFEKRLDVLLGDVVHVPVAEEQRVVGSIRHADRHGEALPMILMKGDRSHAVERAGDLDRAILRAVADDDHFVDSGLDVSARRTSPIVFSSL